MNVTPSPTLPECIESLELHLRCLQRTGLRFDAPGAQQAACVQTAAERLEALHSASIECTRCRRCAERTHVVFGEGCAEARLMFVGSVPDSASDAQGRPFAGESGQLLTRIIEAIRLQRSQVYLTDVVKCCAAQADEPADDAIKTCLPILQRQIEIIQPEIICALGPVTARALHIPGDLNAPASGQFFRMGTVLVMPTHHPELLLRRPELKQQTWVAVQRIQRELESHPPRKN